MKNKIICSLILMIVCITCMSVISFAKVQFDVDNEVLTYEGPDITITFNGKPVECDIPPILHNDRTLLPIRAVINELDGSIEWDGILRMVTISYNDKKIAMCIDNTRAVVDGEKIEMDVAPRIAYFEESPELGRTVLPVRFVMENLGLEVEWDPETYTVNIVKEVEDVLIDPNDPNIPVEPVVDPDDENTTPVEPDEVIPPALNELFESNIIKVGIYYNGNVKSSLNVKSDTDIKVGVMENDKFVEKYTIGANSRIVITISGSNVKITDDGTMLDSIGDQVILIPEKNTADERFITVNDCIYRGGFEFTKSGSAIKAINILPLEEYLYSVVPSEMPSSFHVEALKAQAVAARTYAYSQLGRHASDGFNLCTTVHCQVYKGVNNGAKRETDITTQAVIDTKDLVVRYNDELISTYYSAFMGPKTEDVENVWVSYLPYLRSVSNSYEPSMKLNPIYFTRDDIVQKLNDKNIKLGTIVKILVTEYTDAQRASKLVITGTKGATAFVKSGTNSFLNLKGQMFIIEGGEGLEGLANNIIANKVVTEKREEIVDENWIKVAVLQSATSEKNSFEGWVAKEYAQIGENDMVTITAQTSVNLRAEPNTNCEVLTKLTSESICKLLESKSVTEKITEVVTGKMAKINATNLNVREKASTSSNILCQIGLNEGYAVLEEKGNWIKINICGQDGWISKSYAEIIDYDLNVVNDLKTKLINDGISFRIKVTVYDDGHGVGMSQYGALGMARAGFSFEEILKHYYTDVNVSKI